MQKPSVGTIHLVLGLILVSINVFFIFIFVIIELGDIGQTVTHNTTFGDVMFDIVMNVLIFLVLPALGGFEIGRWVQARNRVLQFSAEVAPKLEHVTGETPAKSARANQKIVIIGSFLIAFGVLICVSFPYWVLSLGLFLLFLGFGIVAFGYKPSASSKGTIIAGYVFAALGGVIGLFIGDYVRSKQSIEEKLHGKLIMIVGAIALITYAVTFYVPRFL